MRTALFDYYFANDVNTTMPHLRDRTGQRVEVVHPVGVEEADIEDVGPMWVVRFSDGLLSDVFDDELSDWTEG